MLLYCGILGRYFGHLGGPGTWTTNPSKGSLVQGISQTTDTQRLITRIARAMKRTISCPKSSGPSRKPEQATHTHTDRDGETHRHTHTHTQSENTITNQRRRKKSLLNCLDREGVIRTCRTVEPPPSILQSGSWPSSEVGV